MQAAIVVRNESFHFETRNVPIPDIGPTDILIKLSVSGICGSDIGLAAGHHGPTKDILGHEGVGRVEKLGSAISSSQINIGQRVGIAWIRDICEVCMPCLTDGGETRCIEKFCSGLKWDGTFAEYAIVPYRYVIRLPEDVSDELIAPILCGGVTAYKAIKVCGAIPGQWIIISGAGGGVGSLGIQYAKAMGYRVLAIDIGKKEYCLSIGAESYIEVTDMTIDLVHKTIGGGASAVIVTAGSSKAYQSAIELIAPLGTLVAVGIPTFDQRLSFHPILCIDKGIKIVGSAVGTRKDILEAIEFVKRGAIKPQIELTTLDNLNDIAQNFEKVTCKYVIKF